MTTHSNRRKATPPFASNHPYARLYQAVILRAVQDLAQKEHQDEAREWLLSSQSISPSLRQELAQIAYDSKWFRSMRRMGTMPDADWVISGIAAIVIYAVHRARDGLEDLAGQ